MKKKIALVAMAAAAVCAQAADWSSDTIGYRYAPKSVEKGLDPVRKDIFSFTHASGDKLGTNLFAIDFLKSSASDYATGNPADGSAREGAQEWYGFYQRNFSTTKLTGKQQGFGFFKDINLGLRFDAGSKNTQFGGAPMKVRPGINFDMPVAAGFWNVGVDIYKEWNQQGASTGKPASWSFDTTWALGSAWSIPAGPGTFGGLVSFVGPKGKDQFGAETKTETFIRATYMFDVNGPKSDLTAGLGFDYVNNKFGNDNAQCSNSSCKGTTPLLLVQYKL